MRQIYSEPWYYDILVDDRTGEHFIDVLGASGPYVRRVRLRRDEVARLRENPRLLEELAFRISEDASAEREREVYDEVYDQV